MIVLKVEFGEKKENKQVECWKKPVAFVELEYEFFVYIGIWSKKEKLMY